MRLPLTAASGILALLVSPVAPESPAFERTEHREACADRSPLRNLYFGDTHVHTAFSFDASALGVRNTPHDAYRFARGGAAGLRPYDDRGRAQRTVRLARALDFAVVTDHAGLLGETHICRTPGQPGHTSLVCRIYRRWPLLAYYFVNSRAFNVADPQRYSFCGSGGGVCRAAALIPWRATQEAAESAYDRSRACSFTTFIGYEWSGGPEANMIHRNVIFRNHVVPRYPTSYVDEPRPEGLWRKLHEDCLDAGNGCDVLAIPHNSNLSGGWLLATESSPGNPVDPASFATRAALEPLVEIMQHKGDSECRLGGATEDELCGFEKLPYARMSDRNFPFLWKSAPQGSFVREALGAGLLAAERHGVNPLKLGIVAASDTHLGTPGLVDERGYPGHGAGGDTARVEVPLLPDAVEFNPGGLTAVWAEENSRDAIFTALRRREAYGTSGPRIAVRAFGGWDYPQAMCESASFVADGYAGGVPMGGDLPARPRAGATPRLAVWAAKDPGTDDRPGADLHKIQVIKIRVEDGEVRESVVDIAGLPQATVSVDPASCTSQGSGSSTLCAVWSDPGFDADRPALYYARVVEQPSCRWQTHVCNARAVDCDRPRTVPAALRVCCDPDAPKTIRERAWTSPIWFTPRSGGRSARGAGIGDQDQ